MAANPDTMIVAQNGWSAPKISARGNTFSIEPGLKFQTPQISTFESHPLKDLPPVPNSLNTESSVWNLLFGKHKSSN